MVPLASPTWEWTPPPIQSAQDILRLVKENDSALNDRRKGLIQIASLLGQGTSIVRLKPLTETSGLCNAAPYGDRKSLGPDFSLPMVHRARRLLVGIDLHVEIRTTRIFGTTSLAALRKH